MKRFLRKLGWLIRRKTKENELREEIEFHLEATAEEHEESGLPSDKARAEARREFGNVKLLKEDTRAEWAGRPWRVYCRTSVMR